MTVLSGLDPSDTIQRPQPGSYTLPRVVCLDGDTENNPQIFVVTSEVAGLYKKGARALGGFAVSIRASAGEYYKINTGGSEPLESSLVPEDNELISVERTDKPPRGDIKALTDWVLITLDTKS